MVPVSDAPCQRRSPPTTPLVNGAPLTTPVFRGTFSLSMRSWLVLVLVVAQILWWDLVDKSLMLVSYSLSRRHINRTITSRAVRLFALARFSVGLALRMSHPRHSLPPRMLIVCNHQSLIDIAAVMAAFPDHIVRFVAKRELRRWFPAVSRVLRVQRHALIPRRGDFGTAMREIDRLGRTLVDGEAAAIFPEGTRSRDGVVRHFSVGAVRRLHAAQPLPLVAVAVDGGWQFADLAGLRHIRPGDEFRVGVVATYPLTRSKSELVAQIADAEQRIAAQVADWRR